MSPPGATKPPENASRPRLSGNENRSDSKFLPNFCDPRMALGVVLISELLALTFSLARPAAVGFLTELARISLLVQWLGLTSAALLCGLRRPLESASVPTITAAVLTVVLGNILLLSVAVVWFGRWLGSDEDLALFPARVWPFAARNLGIGLIVTSLLLRYFFVSHQWRRHVESEARTRIRALQARIRPHFLFNSMNTIAALTRSDPRRAEAAVEDLADLFRASLGDAGRRSDLGREIELAQLYERIEQLRLGDRLTVDWDLAQLPRSVRLPTLTLQPLLENAILHGIEALERGGTVSITGRLDGDIVEIVISNPVAADAGAADRQGQGMATANIRERLELAFRGRASLTVERTDARYDVSLRFPRSE
jgi:two-component system sensor histidine kinase AlgZ